MLEVRKGCGLRREQVMNGIERIAAERERQIEGEGWMPEHDDEAG